MVRVSPIFCWSEQLFNCWSLDFSNKMIRMRGPLKGGRRLGQPICLYVCQNGKTIIFLIVYVFFGKGGGHWQDGIFSCVAHTSFFLISRILTYMCICLSNLCFIYLNKVETCLKKRFQGLENADHLFRIFTEKICPPLKKCNFGSN